MTTNDRRSKTESTADLVNTPTGRKVVFGRVQIHDQDVFARLTEQTIRLLTQYGEHAMDQFVTGWEQENGSLHIIVAPAGAPVTHLMVEKGKWRELDQATYDAFSQEVEGRMHSVEAEGILESVAGIIDQQFHRNSIREAAFSACSAAIMVIDRSMDGFSLAGKVAKDVPSLQPELDAWIEGQAPFALVHMDAAGRYRTLTSINDLSDLDVRGFAAVAELHGDLSSCIIVSSATGDVAKQIADAWERRGGNTIDGLADDVAIASDDVGEAEDDPPDQAVAEALAMAIAYPGAKGMFEIKRSWIEASDLDPMHALFGQLQSSPEAADFFSGSILISVDGYNDDSRMLCEIPEVRAYALRLLEKYPSWFYFMYHQPVEFNLWVGVLTEAKVLQQVNLNLAQFSYDALKVVELFDQVRVDTRKLFLEMGWPQDDPRAENAAAEIDSLFLALLKEAHQLQ